MSPSSQLRRLQIVILAEEKALSLDTEDAIMDR